MSALDQAFIKAFQRDPGVALEPPEPKRRERRLRPPVKATPVVRQIVPAPIEDPYAEGAWYRTDSGVSESTAEPAGDTRGPAPATPPPVRSRIVRRPHVKFRELAPEVKETAAPEAVLETRSDRASRTKPTPEIEARIQRPAREKMASAAPPAKWEPAKASTTQGVEAVRAAATTPDSFNAAFTVAFAGGWESHFVAPAVLIEPVIVAPAPAPLPTAKVKSTPVRIDPPEASTIAKPHFPLVAGAAENASVPQAETAGSRNEVEAAKIAEPKAPAPQPEIKQQEIKQPEVAPADVATPEVAAPALPEFQPAWEVERFSWPASCDELLASAFDDWGLAVRQLLANAKRGAKTLAVAGLRRGEGRSSLALCLARLAAKTGARIAIIDADFENPQLAATLGVGTECDWRQALADGQPLEEASIICLADELTLMPLQSATRFKQVSFRQPAIAGMLKTAAAAFDLVLVDVGPIAAPEYISVWGGKSCPFDGVLFVRDLRRTDSDELSATVANLQKQGLNQIVAIENFFLAPAV